jgi:hypothetical protein
VTYSEMREFIRSTIDDSVLTHTGRSIGDIASERVVDDLIAAMAGMVETE